MSVGSQEVVHLGEEEKYDDVQVSEEDVTKAIRKVMDKEIEGNDRRKRAKELGEMAKKTLQSDGSSHISLTLLIKEIQEFQFNKS